MQGFSLKPINHSIFTLKCQKMLLYHKVNISNVTRKNVHQIIYSLTFCEFCPLFFNIAEVI